MKSTGKPGFVLPLSYDEKEKQYARCRGTGSASSKQEKVDVEWRAKTILV